MPRLSAEHWVRKTPELEQSQYDRAAKGIGIVHIGPGAFHRAHQAYYTDLALEKGGHWAISAVSMNSTGVGEALNPQAGLYTLAVQDIQSSYRLVGSIKEVLHLPSQREEVMARMCAASTQVVTMTVTEKGYMLGQDGALLVDHPSVLHDLANPDCPKTVIGLLAKVITERSQASKEPMTIISCDNVSDNGDKLKGALLAYAKVSELHNLSTHIERQRFPNTMVDCITPASDEALSTEIAGQTGIEDAWPIKREAFSQWVIEDLDGMSLPAWGEVGVTFTRDIQAHENAKLRILNLAHSALAYLGPLYGCETVYQAISRHDLRQFVDDLLDQEVMPGLAQRSGDTLDHSQYKKATITRFENPHIKHRLAQIGQDGSQKLAIRAVPALKENLAAQEPVGRLCELLIAWSYHVFLSADNDANGFVDPLSETLTDLIAGRDFSLESVKTLLVGVGFFREDEVATENVSRELEEAFTKFMERVRLLVDRH